MNKLIYSLLFTGLLITSISASGQDSSSKEVVTVGVKITPPFIMKTDNGYEGLSIDLWTKIADNMGIEYKYEEYILVSMLEALKKHHIDVCISPLTVTSKRMEKFSFTQPFYFTNLAIATKQGSTSFISKFFSFKLVIILIIALMDDYFFVSWQTSVQSFVVSTLFFIIVAGSGLRLEKNMACNVVSPRVKCSYRLSFSSCIGPCSWVRSFCNPPYDSTSMHEDFLG